MWNVQFKIGSTIVDLEHVLIDIDYVPIIMVGKDSNNNRYLILTVDIHSDIFIAVELSLENLDKFLNGKLSTSDTFLSNGYFWKIDADSGVENDISTKYSINEIEDVLTEEESDIFKHYKEIFFLPYEKHNIEYVKKIHDLFSNK